MIHALKKHFFTQMLCLMSCVILVSQQAKAEVQTFSIPTKDGTTQLKGQLDLPQGADKNTAKYPLVVMMPGTGIFDRDVLFGPVNQPNSLIFKTLSQALNKEGIATLRFDYRGVSCNAVSVPVCENCETPKSKSAHYLKTCLNPTIRQQVTPKNLRNDLESVYLWGKKNRQIDPEKMLVFAHSEGSVHTAYLVAQKRIQPKGIVLMGGLYESPSAIVNWQLVERLETQVLKADLDNNKQITAEEVKTYRKTSPFLQLFPEATFLPHTDFWTQETLHAKLSSDYKQVKEYYLKQPDTDPYPSSAVVQASMKWWKMFFKDKTSVGQNFLAAGIPVINHIGTYDSQVNLSRQRKSVATLNAPHQLKLVTHLKKGHTLGSDPLFGPVSRTSQRMLIKSIKKLLIAK